MRLFFWLRAEVQWREQMARTLREQKLAELASCKKKKKSTRVPKMAEARRAIAVIGARGKFEEA